MAETFSEIEIRDFVTWDAPSEGEELRVGANVATRATIARDVLREIAEARAGGARALLVHVTGPGGRCAPAFAVYDALREFSRDVALRRERRPHRPRHHGAALPLRHVRADRSLLLIAPRAPPVRHGLDRSFARCVGAPRS
jgi:hypothetical protein